MDIMAYVLRVEQAIEDKQIRNQRKILKYILNKNRNTYIGKQYNFQQIKSYKDFRQLPLTRYDTYENLVKRVLNGEPQTLLTKDKIIAFLKTSGTTSDGKLLPTTHQFLHSNHYYSSRSLMHHLVRYFDFGDYLFARNLSLSGYYYRDEGGFDIIDMSAVLIKHLPFYVQGMNFPNKVFSTWESKLAYIIEHLDSLNNVRLMLGVPTWILSLLNHLSEVSGKRIPELFPNWKVYIHGGVNFNPYRSIFNELLEKELIYQEVYNATEGFFAFQDRPDADGMLLLTGGHIFYEFIPFDEHSDAKTYHEHIRPLEDVELNQDYLMVITTEYGLYRYIMGDVVRFTTVNPYRLKVSGRESEYINGFGEDLTMFHVNNALQDLSKDSEVDFRIRDFIISPKYSIIGFSGYHEWLIEFIHEPKNLALFTTKLDALLQTYNTNYKQKRRGDITMKRLEIICLKEGVFEQHLRKNKVIGGQAKMKKLFNDRIVSKQILELNK